MTAALLPFLRDLYGSHVTGYYGRDNTFNRGSITDKVLEGHLEGRYRVGTYFDPGDGTVILGVIDLDNKENPDGEKPHAKRAAEALLGLGLSAEIFTSKGKGYHIPVYFAEPVAAWAVRKVLAYAAEKAGRPGVEVFPRQDKVDVYIPPVGSKESARVGSYINLPFHGTDLPRGRTALLNKANGLDPYPDQAEAAEGIKKNSGEDLAGALAMIGEDPTPPARKPAGPIGEKLTEGQRRPALFSYAGTMRDRSASPKAILAALRVENELRCEPMLPDEELRKLADGTEKYEPKHPLTVTGARVSTPTSADLAVEYLAARGETIRFWRGSFYRWTGTHYEELPASDLAADVIRFLQGTANRRSAGTRAAGEILANVKALTFIPSNVEPPILILPDGPAPAPRGLIPLADGNFDVEKYLAGEDDALSPHTSALFGLYSLPYGHISGAECPTFHGVMEENLPDPEHRAYLQEWIGLNLISDPTFEAFMIYTGEAGTGKTVTCTIQSTLLGPASVSAIPLEAFNPVRTFPLAALVGKLANIAEEIGECDKAAEGLLKQLVTGSPVTIERKYGDPFQLRNRARLTFATNVLPRFADRSNGIWRRMLILPFSQVVPEEKRDRRFLDPEWWIGSGELPGVFLWALEGLRRLRARGRFNEPVECRVIREEYKRDSNPAGVFLLDHCAADITATTPGNALFKAYAAHVKEQGQHPLSEPMFAREVKRLFPLADKQKNPTWQSDGTKTRVWMGIRFSGRTPS